MRATSLFTARFVKSTRPGIILGATITSSLASALMTSRPSRAEEDYVHSIRSEGHNLEQLDRRLATIDEKTVDGPIKDFETLLLKDSPDSYRIYQQLTTEERQSVFNFYQKERNLKLVRHRIIDLRLGH